jgi:hypothetical protein
LVDKARLTARKFPEINFTLESGSPFSHKVLPLNPRLSLHESPV